MSRFRPQKLIKTVEEPVLNLERSHFETVINGIRITGTWLRTGPGRWTPCLALTHGGRDPRRCTPCVIPLETSWIWAFHGDIGDPKAAFITITDWLRDGLLPGEPGMSKDYMRIVSAVNSRLSDLIAMPPRPPGEEYTIGHAKIINVTSGKIIAEQEIKNDV